MGCRLADHLKLVEHCTANQVVSDKAVVGSSTDECRNRGSSLDDVVQVERSRRIEGSGLGEDITAYDGL